MLKTVGKTESVSGFKGEPPRIQNVLEAASAFVVSPLDLITKEYQAWFLSCF